ncbi:hypothetical protein C7374_12215 [Falsochrobactrum ovis]|uniref:Uncharacterized protein n=1 Tax=Falsochrobactrum ovis TaxID=1293442 RepID=A0A364JRW3_9HYPH|nr:hypothetical protein C7374_12215 [Falsochrobactrum ovis]
MEISRSALYDLVWSHPITEIAKLYGIPAVKVARACDDHDIVRPRAGYWQKLAVGKAPEKSDIISVEYSADDLGPFQIPGRLHLNRVATLARLASSGAGRASALV